MLARMQLESLPSRAQQYKRACLRWMTCCKRLTTRMPGCENMQNRQLYRGSDFRVQDFMKRYCNVMRRKSHSLRR